MAQQGKKFNCAGGRLGLLWVSFILTATRPEILASAQTNVTESSASPVASTTSEGEIMQVTDERGNLTLETTTSRSQGSQVKRDERPSLKTLILYEMDYFAKFAEVGLPNFLGNETSHKIHHVKLEELEPTKLITQLCSVLDTLEPDLILDMTSVGITSEAVKVVTRALHLPTVSTAIGQSGDIREWRGLTESESKYLIQIRPPTDAALHVVRHLALHLKLDNMAVLYTQNYNMVHHERSLFLDTSVRFMFLKVDADPNSLRKKRKKEIGKVLLKIIKAHFTSVFIAASVPEIEAILEIAAEFETIKKYETLFLDRQPIAWFTLSMSKNETLTRIPRNVKTVVNFYPEFPGIDKNEKMTDVNWGELGLTGSYLDAFYMDLFVNSMAAAGRMKLNGSWPIRKERIPCASYTVKSRPELHLNLLENLREVGERRNARFSESHFAFGGSNGQHGLRMDLQIERLSEGGRELLGRWGGDGAEDQGRLAFFPGNNLDTVQLVYRVVTVVEPPFVFKQNVTECGGTGPPSHCFHGYAIDILEELGRRLSFNFTLREETAYGFMKEKLPHNWDGMIAALQYKEAEIAVGALSVFPEREQVVDFTWPIYGLVGYQILMRKEKLPTTLFKFLTVLENDVWICIIGAYFFTSGLMWVFDRWSPYSFQNCREKYADDEEKREFILKECLWFCMSSLTPQGGGEAPKNLSGRLVAATWWMFGFIIIASYTANLAAFLTVSRLEAPIESLDDLSGQYKVQYSPVNQSSTWHYFSRMAHVEHQFYEAWKDMSLNDTMSEYDRSKLAVWEYPVSDKFTKMWQSILENKPPLNVSSAVARVRGNEHSQDTPDTPDTDDEMDDFAWIGESPQVQFFEMTNCNYRVVGEEFSMNPYAFGVQKGSPLKEALSQALRDMERERLLEKLRTKWWDFVKKQKNCVAYDELADGIGMLNIGGVFIIILCGMALSTVVTLLEVWWSTRWRVSNDFMDPSTESKGVGAHSAVYSVANISASLASI